MPDDASLHRGYKVMLFYLQKLLRFGDFFIQEDLYNVPGKFCQEESVFPGMIL